MTPMAVLITIIASFIVLFGISYFSGRKADNAGFFSGVTFVSVPGMVAASNFSIATTGLDQAMMQKTQRLIHLYRIIFTN
ncbi:hypothetical protein SAMD00024442_87_8 [Candidatus Symbiothrix dinenymphae]|nr:hypothetical protein SAMD00024442_87_8 [Candidatus Symbiothrix dinenymphae]